MGIISNIDPVEWVAGPGLLHENGRAVGNNKLNLPSGRIDRELAARIIGQRVSHGRVLPGRRCRTDYRSRGGRSVNACGPREFYIGRVVNVVDVERNDFAVGLAAGVANFDSHIMGRGRLVIDIGTGFDPDLIVVDDLEKAGRIGNNGISRSVTDVWIGCRQGGNKRSLESVFANGICERIDLLDAKPVSGVLESGLIVVPKKQLRFCCIENDGFGEELPFCREGLRVTQVRLVSGAVLVAQSNVTGAGNGTCPVADLIRFDPRRPMPSAR